MGSRASSCAIVEVLAEGLLHLAVPLWLASSLPLGFEPQFSSTTGPGLWCSCSIAWHYPIGSCMYRQSGCGIPKAECHEKRIRITRVTPIFTKNAYAPSPTPSCSRWLRSAFLAVTSKQRWWQAEGTCLHHHTPPLSLHTRSTWCHRNPRSQLPWTCLASQRRHMWCSMTAWACSVHRVHGGHSLCSGMKSEFVWGMQRAMRIEDVPHAHVCPEGVLQACMCPNVGKVQDQMVFFIRARVRFGKHHLSIEYAKEACQPQKVPCPCCT